MSRSVGDRFTGSVLYLFPLGLDQLDHVVGHRDVIQIKRHLVTAFVSPFEELESDGGIGGLILFLVHQDKGRASNGPAFLAWLIGQDLVEAWRLVPLRIGRCSSEGTVIRVNIIAVTILQMHVRHFVLMKVVPEPSERATTVMS